MALIWKEIFIRPIFNLLIFLHNVIPGHDLGIAIILLTLLIRLALYPQSKKALVSQKALQKLQPEIEKIKKKYKDKQQQAQEMMKLYKEYKINPMSSCLPMLFQLPFLIALFVVLSQYLPNGSFDLLYPFVAFPPSLNTTFLGMIDLVGVPQITTFSALLTNWGQTTLAFLAGITQFYQSKMMIPKTKSADPTASLSRQMTYFFPFLTVFIALRLPAGLALSWVTTTVFAIITQYTALKK